MIRVTSEQRHALFDIATTRQLELRAQALLPPHALMQRAGHAVAQLALALAPHARTYWVACGPGNNGGDGFEAAAELQRMGKRVFVTHDGTQKEWPEDASQSLARAHAAGVTFTPQAPAELDEFDLCIDALLGIGSKRAPAGHLADCIRQVNCSRAAVLAIDLPSGLNADHGNTGDGAWPLVRANHTLSLLTLKPGLFTALGRDAAGQVWWDDLGVDSTHAIETAELTAVPARTERPHASHKGSFGDVAVLGGEGMATRGRSMDGAARLAALAALHAGAGRVYLALLDENAWAGMGAAPELMLHRPEQLDLAQQTLVCGCGGGEAIRPHLPRALSTARRAVFDADALNAIAQDSALQTLLQARAGRGHQTVLTPHPLEAARLLGCTVQEVQAQRLAAADRLSQRYQCTVLLKGSGSVIATPQRLIAINPTGNARLATAGTGDVLAGAIGAALAAGHDPHEAARDTAFRHGLVADQWSHRHSLTAGELARRMMPG